MSAYFDDADPRIQKTADWCRHWGDVHGVDDMEAVAQLIERLQARAAELEQEKTALIKLGQEDSRYQNLLSETQSLRTRVAELEDKYRRKASKVVALLAEKNLQHDVLMDNEGLIESLQARVEELTAALEYVAGPMMLGDEPKMGYHCRAIAYIEAALKQE
jgi:DNA repair exonuclease SbcCD ATPase subunit